MLFERLLRKRPARAAGQALYARAVEQARTHSLYAALRAPDTVEGRFEVYSLHVVLLLDRLRGEGPQAAETAQGLFDAYVTQLDHALREMGVGDLSVGKKMRKLGEAFYGRVKSYEQAFAALPAVGELEALLSRTVYADIDDPPTAALSAYVLAQRDHLARAPMAQLQGGAVEWAAL